MGEWTSQDFLGVPGTVMQVYIQYMGEWTSQDILGVPGTVMQVYMQYMGEWTPLVSQDT